MHLPEMKWDSMPFFLRPLCPYGGGKRVFRLDFGHVDSRSIHPAGLD